MNAPSRVGVLGGGRMGAGIAHAFLLAGSDVLVVERDEMAAIAARDRILASLAESIARGTTSQDLGAFERLLAVTVAIEDFSDRELVIEAVPEHIDTKVDALRRVEGATPPGAVLASNTSSISIDALAGALSRPERFLGLHFFNPVPASLLVEIVLGTATDAAIGDAARDWVAALGKTAVTVHDSPGFASSRLGVALALEAMRMLEDGVASAADIDAAMTLGYRHPLGPLESSDIVGLDVRLGIAEYLHAELGERFAPPALLRRLVAEGMLGRKTGEGFYTWGER